MITTPRTPPTDQAPPPPLSRRAALLTAAAIVVALVVVLAVPVTRTVVFVGADASAVFLGSLVRSFVSLIGGAM